MIYCGWRNGFWFLATGIGLDGLLGDRDLGTWRVGDGLEGALSKLGWFMGFLVCCDDYQIRG